ncbi:MAG: hypothetical protein ACRECC_12295 [Pseudolabrys sp.]|jgi:hypothetical protein
MPAVADEAAVCCAGAFGAGALDCVAGELAEVEGGVPLLVCWVVFEAFGAAAAAAAALGCGLFVCGAALELDGWFCEAADGWEELLLVWSDDSFEVV